MPRRNQVNGHQAIMQGCCGIARGKDMDDMTERRQSVREVPCVRSNAPWAGNRRIVGGEKTDSHII